MSTETPASKPKPKSIRDEILARADAGDLSGLIDVLSGSLVPFEQNERPILIRQALEAHLAKGGTAAVVEAVLGQAILFDAEFLMIAQTRIRAAMNDSIKRYGITAGPPEHVVKEELPRLAAIEAHLATLAKTMASVRHTFALADSPTALTVQRRSTRKVIQMRDALEA